jgi:prepilin-type N-terminal cleavage/methylation domain-containing protein
LKKILLDFFVLDGKSRGMTRSAQAGFTLVELSIVLVIIGLIVGGIIGGNSIIQSAKVNSVISDIRKYQTAILMFKDKYDYLPGDLPTATSYFPTSVGNGDGDSLAEWMAEAHYAWQQMALAGIIPGSYPGTTATGAAIPGLNIPKSRIDGAGFSFNWSYDFWAGNYNATTQANATNNLYFGKMFPAAAGGNAVEALTPQDTKNIDTKIDDGMPLSGKMRGANAASASGACTNGSNYTKSTTATYTVSNTGVACMFTYRVE